MSLFVTGLAADTVDFSTLIANQEIAVGQTYALTVEPYASGENGGGYYVGLTEGILAINSNLSVSILMYCVDFMDDISVPTTYNISVVSLNSALPTPDPLGLTLSQLQTQYILGQNFGTTPSGDSAADTDIQEDIWNFTGGTFGVDTSMQTLLNGATTTLGAESSSSTYFSNGYLLNVTAEPGEQAFMPVTTPPTVVTDLADPLVPEPGTFLLLGLGLASCWGIAKRTGTLSSRV